MRKVILNDEPRGARRERILSRLEIRGRSCAGDRFRRRLNENTSRAGFIARPGGARILSRVHPEDHAFAIDDDDYLRRQRLRRRRAENALDIRAIQILPGRTLSEELSGFE